MDITEFTFRLMLLGMPGICCYFLLKKLIGKIGADSVEAVLSIFVFSVLSYLTADCLLWVLSNVKDLGVGDNNFRLIRSLVGDLTKIGDKAIAAATLCSVFVAGALAGLYRKKVWNRICQRLRLTNRFGDEDVFNFLLGSNADLPRWYVVRDYKESLTYYAAITAWSDENDDRELILSEVDVYSNEREDGKATLALLYSCANLYLCRKRDDISIEIIPEKPGPTEETHVEQ